MSLVGQKINGDHDVIYVKTVIHQYLQLVDLYLDTKNESMDSVQRGVGEGVNPKIQTF